MAYVLLMMEVKTKRSIVLKNTNEFESVYINVTESDVEDGAPNITIVDSDAEDDIDVEI